MRFLIAPDKYKGGLSAEGVARAIARGLRDAFPRASLRLMPLADGGDGTARILSRAFKARNRSTRVQGPRFRPVNAAWGLLGTRAFMDMASASGLALLKPEERDPMQATSRGIGQLILAATKAGAREITLGVGGSATVDGGLGALRALGIRFLDARRRDVPEGGAGLLRIATVDTSACCLRGTRLALILLSDVTNPLLGPKGAAPVFGPQKGASPEKVKALTRGLERLGAAILRATGCPVARMPHGGAAGGIVAGFSGLLGTIPGIEVRAVSGIEHLLRELDADAAVRKADWIFTGEGRLDDQTERGKTLAGLAALCRRHRKPVIAIAGSLDISLASMDRMGLQAVFAIPRRSCTLAESIAHESAWIRATAANAARLIRAASHGHD
ncbi:MAG: glycerate kinase [Verrucomicrobiae bacterium]|nr:glycerate kinase [Verrucomicrobiae bacterium]